MSREEYYAILKAKWEAIDKNDLAAIKAYNAFREKLRQELDTDKEGDWWEIGHTSPLNRGRSSKASVTNFGIGSWVTAVSAALCTRPATIFRSTAWKSRNGQRRWN